MNAVEWTVVGVLVGLVVVGVWCWLVVGDPSIVRTPPVVEDLDPMPVDALERTVRFTHAILHPSDPMVGDEVLIVALGEPCPPLLWEGDQA